MITQQIYPGMVVAISEDTFDEPLQDLVDATSTSQSALKISGVFKRTTPLVLRTNTNLSGDMYGFKSAIRAYDCPAIIMDGQQVEGGFCFNNTVSNLSVWLDNVTTSIPYALYTRDAYRCSLKNVRFIGGEVSDTKCNNLLHIDGIQNLNDYHKIIAMGSGTSSSGSAIKVSNTKGSVVLYMPDVEGSFRGINIAPNAKVDIHSPYTERCSVAIDINAGNGAALQTPVVNVFGGNIQLASATSIGFRFMGAFNNNECVNLYGPSFFSDDKILKNNAFKFNNFSWTGQPRIFLSGIDWSWINKPLQLQGSSVIFPYNPF